MRATAPSLPREIRTFRAPSSVKARNALIPAKFESTDCPRVASASSRFILTRKGFLFRAARRTGPEQSRKASLPAEVAKLHKSLYKLLRRPVGRLPDTHKHEALRR